MSKKIISTNINKYGKVKRGKYIKGGECIIPFYFKNKLHNDCADSNDGKWCPTSLKKKGQTFKNGVPVSRFRTIGYCSSKKKQPIKNEIETKKYPIPNNNFRQLKNIIKDVKNTDYFHQSKGWDETLLITHLKNAQIAKHFVNVKIDDDCDIECRQAKIKNMWLKLNSRKIEEKANEQKANEQKAIEEKANEQQEELNKDEPLSIDINKKKRDLTYDDRKDLMLNINKNNIINCDFQNTLYWLINENIPKITKRGAKFLGAGSSGIAFAGCPDAECNKRFALKLIKRKTSYDNNSYHPTNVEIKFLEKIKTLFTRKITPHVTLMYFHFECNLKHSILKSIYNESEIPEWKEELEEELKENTIYPTAPIAVIELANGGDLQDYLKNRTNNNPLADLEWNVLFFQIFHMLVVMQYHFPGFRHNDLKPNNILVNTYDKKQDHYFKYKMFGKTYYVPDIGVTLKLWDFDFALDNDTFNDRVSHDTYKKVGYSNKPNPVYDVHSFLNYLYIFNNNDLSPKIKQFIETLLPETLRGKKSKYTNHYRLTHYNVTKDYNNINIIPHTLKSPAKFLTTYKEFLDFTIKPENVNIRSSYDTLIPEKKDIKYIKQYNSLFADNVTQIMLTNH